jgi:hypothetical protein
VPRIASGTFGTGSPASIRTAILTTAGTTLRTSGAKLSGPVCTSGSALAAPAKKSTKANNMLCMGVAIARRRGSKEALLFWKKTARNFHLLAAATR